MDEVGQLPRIVLERWNLERLMTEEMANTMVLALWRYLTYLGHWLQFSGEHNYLTKFMIAMVHVVLFK